MSLRWKLFRFLSVDTFLSPTPADSIDYESSLFPSLSPSTPSNSNNTSTYEENNNALLSRFSVAADRSVHSHSADSIYAFALPRAVVQLFNIPALNLSTLSSGKSINSSRRNFPSQVSFSAHDNAVIAVHLLLTDEELPMLITLGIDDSGGTVKIWTLHSPPLSLPSHPTESEQPSSTPSSTDQSSSLPTHDSSSISEINGSDLVQCLSIYRFQGDARPTSLAVNSISQSPYIINIAIGFIDGVVIILYGDIISERASRIRVAPAPGEMIEPRPVIFLSYDVKSLLYSVSEVSIAIIITTSNKITSSTTTKHKISIRRTVLDNLGIKNHDTCCILPYTNELVVAKPEALFFFNRDGRGSCLAFPTDGKRPLIYSVAHYLIHSTGHGSITVYDIVNKLIAYRGKGIITCAFASSSISTAVRSLGLCMGDGSVLRLNEIGLDERVSMLLKRGLYLSAVRLAQTENKLFLKDEDEEKIINRKIILTKALKQYAEYLMSKNRYDEAAEQLIETIGASSTNYTTAISTTEDNNNNTSTIAENSGMSYGMIGSDGIVEPSWVITRLVEQSGLRSGLRMYLEALHSAGIASFVHTKVLITCYRHDRARGIILGGSNNMKAIEKTTDEYVINVFSDVDWSEEQVDAAILLCRNAGLYQVAERVARKRKRHVQLAKTLIEDLKQIDDVFVLLDSLFDDEALSVVLACGRKLLQGNPLRFVDYLADAVCKSASGGGNSRLSSVGAVGIVPILRLDALLPLFIDKPQWRAVLLQKVLARPGGLAASEAPRAWILLFESLVCVDLGERLGRTSDLYRTNTNPVRSNVLQNEQDLEEEDEDNDMEQYNDIGMSEDEDEEGVDDDTEIDGEEVKEKQSKNKNKKRDSLGNSSAGGSDGSSIKRVGRRALKILQNRWSVIDLRGALDVAEQYGHELCLEYLYEHLRMYKELGVCLRLSCNYDGLLKACRRHGEREPYLWLEGLRLFVPAACREENSNVSNIGHENEDNVNILKKKTSQSGDIEDENEDGQDDDGHLNKLISITTVGGRKIKVGAQEVVDEAMQALERSATLSTLEILEVVVESCGEGGWGIIRGFFDKSCSSLRKNAISIEHSAALLECEGNELKKEAIRLRDETIVIKPKNCTACEDSISLPAIHFFCGHSYHVSCLASNSNNKSDGNIDNSWPSAKKDNDGGSAEGGLVEECVKCAPELDAVLNMKKAVVERNEKHDEFFATLRSARDGFASIVEFLERSPFL